MLTIDTLKNEEIMPVIIVNGAGLLTYVNKIFEETFQWQPKEILGKPLTVIIPKRFHDAHHLGFARFIITEQTPTLNKVLVKKDGQEFVSEHVIVTEKKQDQWAIAARIQPILEDNYARQF